MPTLTPTPAPAPTFDPAAVHVSEYAAPVVPQYLGAAPDGSVYLGYGGNGTGSNLYRYAGGSFTQTQQAPPSAGYQPGGGVYGITATARQVYWLSAYAGPGFVPYVAVNCGANGSATICEPTVDEPTSMLVDAGGTFWVGGWTFSGGGKIVTSSQAGGEFTEGIVQLVNGPDGAVWGALENYPSYAIAQFAMNGGTVSISKEFPLPGGDAAGSITYGGDGALWFTDQQRNAIGRMDKNGSLTEYPLSSANALGQPWYGMSQIATACDGSVWFTEPGVNRIGRIAANGAIKEFSLPTADALPEAISATGSPNCAAPQLWVAEQHANKIASISF